MLVTVLIFLVLLACAYAAWHLLPPPADVIVAVIVGIVAVIYLVTHLDALEGADAAVAGFTVLPLSFVAMAAGPPPPGLADPLSEPKPGPVLVDPLPNKALVSALGTVVLVVLRWLVSGELQLDDEGLIALAGAVTSLLVYAVSNFRRLTG